MSFMRAAEGCLRRAHMDRAAGVPSDGDAIVGTLFHDCAATIGFVCSMRGLAMVTPDEAVEIARKVLRRPEQVGPMSRSAHHDVLELVARWAKSPWTEFRPGELFEVLSERPLAGRPLSARLDRYWLDGPTLEIIDYKSGWGDPPAGLTMQGEVYAWHGFEREPDIEVVSYAEEHVRFGVRNGPYELTRDDVYGPGGIEQFLIDGIERIEAAYVQGGELPASPGSTCSSPSRCPHAKTCPIPEWARLTTTVESRHQAEIVFASLLVQEQRRAADTLALRGWLTHVGERALQLGGEEIGTATKPGQMLDKKAVAAAVDEGTFTGSLDDYMKVTNPSFGRRKAR